MEAISEEERDAFLTTFRREAVHLEMRDVYATNIEKDRFATWLRGQPLDPQAEAAWWRPWFELMQRNNQAGNGRGGCVSSANRLPTTSGLNG